MQAVCDLVDVSELARVKSGIFGQTAKFGQRPCLFDISNIGIKNKKNLANSENPDETAHLTWNYTVCKCVSEFT